MNVQLINAGPKKIQVIKVVRELGDATSAAGAGAPALGSASGAPSVADELEKLASLRDRGILTDEEFTAAKTRLLGMS